MNTVNRFCGTVFADTNIATINSIPLCGMCISNSFIALLRYIHAFYHSFFFSDCTSPFVVNIRTDNAKDATDTRISRG